MALPAPVARLVRATAGRRALQLALLFGGLFVLGILCGGRAQADGLSDAGASGVDSLRSGHVAVREHVADSARKLREAGSREAPASADPATDRPAEPAAEPEHMDAKAPAESGPEQAPAPPRDRIATPERQATPAATPPPADTSSRAAGPSPATTPSSADAPARAAGPASVRSAEPAPHPADARDAAHAVYAVRHKASASAESLRERLESVRDASLGDGRVRMGAAVDAVRYLTAPVGATVHRLTGPVEELATRAVADLVEAVPGRLTDVGLGGLVDIVDPAELRPELPAATTPPGANAPADQGHGERPAAAQAADRSHAAASSPQAYDVERFDDVPQAEAGARAEARPAGPVVPQRPDGVPSAGASAGDSSSTRHGDLHAAAFGGRVPALLASGVTASAGTSPVVDRLREVPEFPG
ncbi:hypothetical protein ACOKM5_16900 [Streptomyces sp. BH097]|uniref:hypothetical protein n=1 Tax=unclassified Streptomyces TaxID=2593676 RepID=UPI003BB5D099